MHHIQGVIEIINKYYAIENLMLSISTKCSQVSKNYFLESFISNEF